MLVFVLVNADRFYVFLDLERTLPSSKRAQGRVRLITSFVSFSALEDTGALLPLCGTSWRAFKGETSA